MHRRASTRSDGQTTGRLFSRTSTVVLGLGSIAFGVWAVARPEQFARFMGADPAMGRWTGLRDLAIGAAIVARPGMTPLLARAVADGWDASTVRKSNMARGAAAFGTWALAAAAARRLTAPRPVYPRQDELSYATAGGYR